MRALLAYDASAGAQTAASLVLATRWPSGSAIHVVAVFQPSAAVVPLQPLAPAPAAISPEVEAQIVAYLDEQVGGLIERLRSAGTEATGRVVRGRPATVLTEEAQRAGADLIVGGSRGHGRIASLVLGSVSAEMVDVAPCPVLIARRPTLRRVLFATDASASAREAEDVLGRWPIFEATPIRVISVAEVVRPWHTGIAPTMYGQVMEAYEQSLEAARREQGAVARDTAGRLMAVGRTVDFAVGAGDAAAAIVEEAATWDADLVVLGSRGLTGLSRLVLGSVARNVLQGTGASVLIVRRREPGGEDR
jgi:nucleotide-binding universal stress UspA family protein